MKPQQAQIETRWLRLFRPDFPSSDPARSSDPLGGADQKRNTNTRRGVQLRKDVAECVARSVCVDPLERYACLGRLASGVRGLGRVVRQSELREVLQEWSQRSAVPRTEEWEAGLWEMFCRFLGNVQFPRGCYLQAIVEIARGAKSPRCVHGYSDDLAHLVRVCREFAADSKEGWFTMAVRTAAWVMGSYRQARKALGRLVADEVLVLVEKAGPRSKVGSKYRYIGD